VATPSTRSEGASAASLTEFVAAAAGADAARVEEFTPLPGGALQESWGFRAQFTGGPFAGVHELVLRRDAAARLELGLDRAREFALMRVLWEAGVRLPEPLWLCPDPAVLGGPFFVMRRVPGTAEGRRIVHEPDWVGDRAALAEALGAELARIHAIRPPRPELDFLPPPAATPAAATLAWARGELERLDADRPALDWGLAWLARNAPPAGEAVLTHGDYRTGNYLADRQGLRGILDWEFAGWGAALSDIGWFCAKCWRFGAKDREAGGIAGRAPFYRGYQAVSGRTIDADAVRYWEVLAHLRWATIALLQGERRRRGAEPAEELARTALRADECELEILLLAEAREPELLEAAKARLRLSNPGYLAAEGFA